MKTITLSAGLLFALCVHAEEPVSANLVGQRVVSSFPGTPVLVCRYKGPEANYEVVSSNDQCASFFRLSSDSESSRTRTSVALARAAKP